MVFSMTGYAALTRDIGRAVMQLELRSVNSRYLDLTFRIGEDLRFAEPIIREQLSAAISRGKVECRASLQSASQTPTTLTLNDNLLAALSAAQDQIRQHTPDAPALSVGEMLRWPGMLADNTWSAAQLTPEVQALAREAIEELRATRAREGAKLADSLRERVASLRTLVARAAPLMPAAVAEYRERLAARLREASASLDEDRIRQEVSLFAQRVDVAEEITRLSTHLDEVERVLKAGGAVGKRLDFMMQELNREANTLASKSVCTEITTIAVDMKLYIEQMREQVQNLE